MENAECLRTFVGHTSTVEGLTVTEEGSLFTGSSDYTAKRWRTLTKSEEMSLKATRRPLGRDLSDPAIGEEGEMGTYGGDPRIQPYDKRKPDTFGGTKGHIFTVKCLEVKDRFLYTGSMDETVPSTHTPPHCNPNPNRS
jgi:WD40 repeat protein